MTQNGQKFRPTGGDSVGSFRHHDLHLCLFRDINTVTANPVSRRASLVSVFFWAAARDFAAIKRWRWCVAGKRIWNEILMAANYLASAEHFLGRCTGPILSNWFISVLPKFYHFLPQSECRSLFSNVGECTVRADKTLDFHHSHVTA